MLGVLQGGVETCPAFGGGRGGFAAKRLAPPPPPLVVREYAHQNKSANALGLDFGGSWIGAAVIAVLAPVYIFYGFESAGDISEETKNAGRLVPRAMRLALIWGGIASFVLTAALLLAMPAGPGGKWQISTEGGREPLWARNRKELFTGTAAR